MDRTATISKIADNLHLIKREMHAHLMKTYDSMELSPAQVELLKQIRCNGPLSHKKLAAEARLTPGAVTQLTDGLDEAGCIVRQQSPDDRRVSLISISPAGEEKLKAAMKQYHELLFGAFDALTDEELAAYEHAQTKLIKWHLEHSPHIHEHKE